MEEGIQFFSEGIEFQLDHPKEVREWLQALVTELGYSIEFLNYVFVSDEHLADLNQQHLDHDTYTDIITFPLHEPNTSEIAGDIYISVDRVRENALEMNVSFQEELHRVMAHGVLHLIGYDDLDDESEAEMRKAEDFALSLRGF